MRSPHSTGVDGERVYEYCGAKGSCCDRKNDRQVEAVQFREVSSSNFATTLQRIDSLLCRTAVCNADATHLRQMRFDFLAAVGAELFDADGHRCAATFGGIRPS